MAADILKLPPNSQENASNQASLAPLLEAMAVRVASLEGDVAVLKAAARAHLLECDAALDQARTRLGQARNVEQRCKQILERVRMAAVKGL